jgi:hypothetical protein
MWHFVFARSMMPLKMTPVALAPYEENTMFDGFPQSYVK